MLKNARGAGRSEALDLEARPDAVAGLHRSGPRPYRVLMYGGGVLEGRGLRDHDFGLPGQVASQLAARSRRGVDLDVLVAVDPTSRVSLPALRGLRLGRYDAVIVVLGDHIVKAGLSQARWEVQFAALAQLLLAETAHSAPIALWDSAHVSHPLGQDRRSRSVSDNATRLGAMTEQMCALTSRIHYREFTAPIRDTEFASRFAPDTYEEWASDIVSPLYPRLVGMQGVISQNSPEEVRNQVDDERFRQRALKSLRLAPGSDALLEAIVRQARLMFGVDTASINILDGAVVWEKATTADVSRRYMRESTPYAYAIDQDGLTLINDTANDPRLAGSPFLAGPDPIRFYAAYPIRTWDGYRVGVLCITDPKPRTMLPGELRPLRDFAGRVEQTLWTAALRPLK